MDFFVQYAPYLLVGAIYGLVFGIIPAAGAKTALLILYSFIPWFKADPYTMVVFTTAVVVGCTVGDQFTSIVMNIPGGGGSAATMVDGYPLARQGQAARALSAGLFSTLLTGIIWGLAVIVLLPYYHFLINIFGIPEMWCFLLLSMTCICFVSNKYWFRGVVALLLGIFLGLVGSDPMTNAQRFTFGWFYLADGIHIPIMIAGIMAIPEVIAAMYYKIVPLPPCENIFVQMKQGFVDAWVNRWLALKCSIIGGVIGVLPGIGGSVVEWLAYGQTVAATKNPLPKFGQGNIKGIVGPEGANMSQKATAYIPAVLFGIPSAPFEAIVISLLAFVGLRLGSIEIINDPHFFHTLSFGFMGSLIITTILGLCFVRYATNITRIPFWMYAIPISLLIIWACGQTTGSWEDYALLAMCCLLGIGLKYFKFNRASFLIGFVLAHRIEETTLQLFSIYSPIDLLNRPLSISLLLLCVTAVIYGLFFNRTHINYA